MIFDALRLRILLESRHMTVEELAEEVEVTPALIYRWLKGLSFPGMEVYIKLCTFFGVDMNFFYPEMRCKKPEAVLA